MTVSLDLVIVCGVVLVAILLAGIWLVDRGDRHRYVDHEHRMSQIAEEQDDQQPTDTDTGD